MEGIELDLTILVFFSMDLWQNLKMTNLTFKIPKPANSPTLLTSTLTVLHMLHQVLGRIIRAAFIIQ